MKTLLTLMAAAVILSGCIWLDQPSRTFKIKVPVSDTNSLELECSSSATEGLISEAVKLKPMGIPAYEDLLKLCKDILRIESKS